MDNIEEKVKQKKEFIKNQVLSEDIKNKIKQAMKEEYEKNDCNKKTNHASKIYKKVIGAVACMIIISGVAFAGSIGDLFTNIFKNTEMNKDQIINPNSIVEINSEYVTNEGVGLNVAYMYEDDDYLYIAMNVKGVDDVLDLIIEEITINDIENDTIYDYKNVYDNDFDVSAQFKRDSKMIFIKFRKYQKFKQIEQLDLNIKKIVITDKNINYNSIRGEWNYKIKKP